MKKGFQFLITLLVLMLVLAMPVFGQDETEAPVPSQEVIVVAPTAAVVEAPVVEPVVDTETAWIDGSIVAWTGWFMSVVFAGLLLVALRELAKAGNSKASLALQFFEASRDMLPVDKWQTAFENKSKETTTPADDIISAITRTVLQQTGVIKEADPSAVSEIKAVG